MQDIESKITKALAQVSTTQESVTAAVNVILEGDLGAGTKVAVIDDPTFSYAGAKGVSKGPSAKGSGFVDVEFANGTTVPLQSSLLLPC